MRNPGEALASCRFPWHPWNQGQYHHPAHLFRDILSSPRTGQKHWVQHCGTPTIAPVCQSRNSPAGASQVARVCLAPKCLPLEPSSFGLIVPLSFCLPTLRRKDRILTLRRHGLQSDAGFSHCPPCGPSCLYVLSLGGLSWMNTELGGGLSYPVFKSWLRSELLNWAVVAYAFDLSI